ncbi:MAG: HD domain-containing protein, partial [Halieaceae bacterium]|nr:HD domain-containing protein [Halieaceae bacterium]
MVEVRKLPKAAELDPASLHDWLCELTDHLDEERIDTLSAVIEIVRDLERIDPVTTSDWTGEADPLMVGLEILHILAELHLDVDALAAGVIYRPVREQRVDLDLIRRLMGDRVADLVDGVLRMAAVSELRTASDAPVLGQATAPNVNIRRMLVAMVDDVRIALIKLAERTVVMRTLKNAPPEQRQAIAQEVFDVYAPLAHRLGIGHIKWELEDLSFRYLRPDAYHRIAKLLDGRRKDRDVFIDRVKRDLERALKDAGLQFELSGRAKHIYSIWRKMQRKGIGFSQVYDIR